jgi:hypothetical protein
MKMITKGAILIALDDQALNFISFLNLSDPNNTLTPTAQNMKLMWDSIDALDWDSTLVQNQLLPLLLSSGYITQAAIDRVNTYLNTPLTF